MPLPQPNDPCPCGRLAPAGPGGSKGKSATPLPFASCCGRYLGAPGLEAMAAPDAESLMRSRYTAFALGRSDYLLATWHPDTRPADLTPDTPPLRWLGLVIHAHHAGQATDTTGTVQFTARYKAGGRAGRLTETSRFVRLAGRWVYLEGDVSAS